MLHSTRVGVLLILGGLTLLAGIAGAQDAQVRLDPNQMVLYQKICQSLVAPCCWRESVAMHRSRESLQARDEIAEMIAAGRSEREILDDFVARYGTRVLIEPPGRRAQWLYVIPILALLVALLAAVRYLRRHVQKPLAT
jgi:cytochrome c-type biogenesis protein CcmH